MEDVIYLTEDFEPVEADDPRMHMVKVRQPDGKIVFGFPEGVKKNKLFRQTFEDHEGRPGKVGGSLPRSSSGSSPLNDKELFHYTDEKSVESIRKGGFNVKQEGYSALLGRGVFFTDEAGTAFSKDFGKARVRSEVDVKNTLEIEGGYLGYFNWVLEEAERTGAPSPNPEDITNIVKKAGYDSVWIRGSSKGNIYIIFDSENIKVKQNQQLFVQGGEGSGNFDHSGRPGLVGGSSKDGGGELSEPRDYHTFLIYAQRWNSGIDHEARSIAHDLASRDKELRDYLQIETFGKKLTGTVTLYRVGNLSEGDITSFFTTESSAQSYQKRMGVDRIRAYKADGRFIIPSGAGSGEVWVHNDFLE